MVALLSELSSLRTLSLGFESSQSRPDRESRSRPPPERPSILPAPALRTFGFKGVVDYLEELVTRIDAPELSALYINYFNQIDFDAPRLAQFIDRTPKLSKRDEAHLVFCPWGARVVLLYRTYMFDFDDSRIRILCQGPDLQLSLIAQICTSSFHPLSTVEDLYIEYDSESLRRVWKNDAIENILWPQLLLPFTAVKNLYLSKEYAPRMAGVMKGLVGGRMTEVLPSLQNVFVEGLGPWGPFQENIGQFAAVRRHSGHPIAISVWDKYSNMKSV